MFEMSEEMEEFRKRVVGRTINEDTFRAYKLWINRFEMWYDADSPPALRDLEDFDTMLADPTMTNYLWDNAVGRPVPNSYSYSSRVQAISAVKLWVRRRYDLDIPEQPQDIAMGEGNQFEPTYLSTEEVSSIIESAPDDCNCPGCQAALALSYDAILRASELTILDVSDVNLDTGVVSVTAKKGSRDSDLSVSDTTAGYIEDYLNESDHSSGSLFRNTYGDPWNARSWATHVGRNHVDAGSHSWGRHTPILHMFQSGQGFGDVYRRARHVDPSTTARYARYVGQDIPDWAGD